jgi:NADH dehydrogenase/NADH:ubiquinone oxidoreductase subunit G
MTPLAEKADIVLPMTALYERAGTIVNTYGEHKTFSSAQGAAGEAKEGADIAAELSLLINKTKGFAMKDVAAAAKKAETGKPGTGAFTPVKAAAAKPYALSTSVLLMAMNQGLLTGSEVVKVLVVREPAMTDKAI